MRELSRTKKELLEENILLKKKIQELERSATEPKPINNDELRKGEENYQILSVPCSSEDITVRNRVDNERQNLEEKLLHAEKMEAISMFARDIANDFNNLLMGIRGIAAVSLLDFEPSHPHYENLRQIEEQVERGAFLTDQLLVFVSDDKYEAKPTDMNDIIQKTSFMFSIYKKDIIFETKCAKDLWTVSVDRGQIKQVFLNLYVNAWQDMPEGGQICLETENVLLNDKQAIFYAVKPGKYVKIMASSIGKRMDKKARKRMRRKTGFGLETACGIIKKHEGVINVLSEPGHGTTFIIFLPASDLEMPKEKMETETGIIATGTETILLVDDNEQIRDVGKIMLESMGYLVHLAASGPEAIAVYLEKGDEISLIILDMIMPGMMGEETLVHLKNINSNVNVLLSSGNILDGNVQNVLDRGCKGFIQKPFSFSRFSSKIRELLD